ncbi:MAG: hypothetical protein LKJ21_07350 [Oscillospiraceae bacterium]|nr:hypothetical protein [Oscillospiraceae bacterium]
MGKIDAERPDADMERAENGRLTLAQMMTSLRSVDDECWGRYLFSRDILRDRIPPDRRDEMIAKSIRCGEEYARRILVETNARSVSGIPPFFGLRVHFSDEPATEKRVLFANFTPPDDITIMNQPMEKYDRLLASLPREEVSVLPAGAEIRDLLLGHELYHFTEERYRNEIYTRTEKIRLWKIFRFQNESTIRALGEIAAMAFARTLARVSYFPALLDVLLLFCYNKDYSRSIYQNIMRIHAAQKDSRG